MRLACARSRPRGRPGVRARGREGPRGPRARRRRQGTRPRRTSRATRQTPASGPEAERDLPDHAPDAVVAVLEDLEAVDAEARLEAGEVGEGAVEVRLRDLVGDGDVRV